MSIPQYTHVFDDLVEIRHILMRDYNCLLYTLHLFMKHNKQYFISLPEGKAMPDLNVMCSKRECCQEVSLPLSLSLQKSNQLGIQSSNANASQI